MSLELLISCARLNPSPESSALIKDLLDKDPDWTKILPLAQDEGITGLLYWNLQHYAERIPEFAFSRIKEVYYSTLRRNLRIYSKLSPLFQAMSENRINAAVIKGAKLAETLYQNAALRPFVDVDLIVAEDQREEMLKLLEKFQFQDMSEKAGGEGDDKNSIFWTFRPLFTRDGIDLEIHYNFPGLHRRFSRMEDLWATIQQAHAGEIGFPVLAEDYELSLLCMHVAQHSFSRLIWLTDIAEMVTHADIDWDRVLSICEDEKIQVPVYYSLHLVNKFWPGTVKHTILKRFHVKSLEKKLLSYFWPESAVLSRVPALLQPMHTPTFFSLLGKKKIGLLLKTMFQFYFPPQAWVSYYYRIPRNSPKMLLHYLWRLYRPFGLLIQRIIFKGKSHDRD